MKPKVTAAPAGAVLFVAVKQSKQKLEASTLMIRATEQLHERS
jgi:hypothetical protein